MPRRQVIPGLLPSLGLSMFYFGMVVLLPLLAVVILSGSAGWDGFWRVVTDARTLAAYRVSFGCALLAAIINTGLGLLVAWVLERYHFPLRRLLDAMVDLPFALPTAISGITLTALWSPEGWLGRILEPVGIRAVFSQTGIVIALVFISFPFVVRTLQPAIQDLDQELEDAASCLGAKRKTVFRRVILPCLRPALATGFTMAFARCIGEYGSIIFIAGNMPYRTEIAPLLIAIKLEQFDTAGAAAVAAGMLIPSLGLMVLISLLHGRTMRKMAD